MIPEINEVRQRFWPFPDRQAMSIAADWCDEQGGLDYGILAGWLRSGEGFPSLEVQKVGNGYGNGNGNGYGNGDGDGNGSGDGSGDGDGNGSGNGYGNGSGNGNGNGYGYGNGYGSGNGNGYGYGYGNGYGDGNGNGDGYGYGNGYGDGNGNGDGKSTSGAKPRLLDKGLPMPKEGDYVCVRSQNQGVVWGTFVYLSGRECRLRNARQQYSWRGNAMTLFDVVVKGPVATNLRLSETVEEIDMTEVCGVILVPQKLVKAFQNHPAS